MEYIVVVVGLVALLATYVTWLAGRIDRLHARSAAARVALEAQLVRRATAAAALAASSGTDPDARALRGAAEAAIAADSDPDQREAVENDLTRCLRTVIRDPADPATEAVLAASRRLSVARQMYNDAVRDTRSLRTARTPRAFRLGARRPLPRYFDIDELDLARLLPPPAPAVPPAGAGVGEATPGQG